MPRDRYVDFAPPGGNDPSKPQEHPGDAPDYLYYPRFRFSSTHFPDGAPIPVKLIVTFKLHADKAADKTVTLESSTYPFEACNKGLAFATKLYVSCQPDPVTGKSGYVIDGSPHDPYYDWDSRRAIVSGANPDDPGDPATADGLGAISQLKKMNHTLDGAFFQKKAELLASLKTATSLFAYTHGEPSAFLPSEGVAGDAEASDKLVTLKGYDSEVGKAVWMGRTNPQMNLVVMHACSLLENDDRLSRAIGILQKDQSFTDAPDHGTPDRAVAGFRDVVQTQLLDRQPDDAARLSDHAKLIYAWLLDGKTVDQAVKEANRTYHTAHNECPSTENPNPQPSPMPMRIKGDPNARLMGVYTGTADDIHDKDGNLIWHVILPPLPLMPSGSTNSGESASAERTHNLMNR